MSRLIERVSKLASCLCAQRPPAIKKANRSMRVVHWMILTKRAVHHHVVSALSLDPVWWKHHAIDLSVVENLKLVAFRLHRILRLAGTFAGQRRKHLHSN